MWTAKTSFKPSSENLLFFANVPVSQKAAIRNLNANLTDHPIMTDGKIAFHIEKHDMPIDNIAKFEAFENYLNETSDNKDSFVSISIIYYKSFFQLVY